MCGIAAILKIHQPQIGGSSKAPHPLEAIPEAWLDVLDESIRHRGPDGQGRFRDRAIRPDGTVVDIALVHRRLSILDHEGGHQPMIHDGLHLRPDLSYQPGEPPKLAHELAPSVPLVAVVFNGCIYNHRELRTELATKGHQFETDHSDTEVLVHGWRAWGKGLQASIYDSSMYAAIVWDRSTADCVPFRDTFGQKPLVMAGRDLPSLTTHLTAKQPPPIARHPLLLCSTAVGPARLLPSVEGYIAATQSWITYGHDPTVIPMQLALSIDRSSVGRLVPWSPHLNDNQNAKADRKFAKMLTKPTRRTGRLELSERHAASAHHDSVDALLRMCVEERLEADVPVACLLSGGVDSSLISAYAQEITGGIQTICVRMPDRRYDESSFAEQAALHLGTEHQTVECDPDAADDLVHLIEQMGLPFGDSSLLPTYWACRAAQEHAGVLLTGDGGDELFIGYERYFAATGWRRELAYFTMPFAMNTPSWLLPQRDPKSIGTKAARWIQMSSKLSYQSLLAVFSGSDARKLLGSNAPTPAIGNLESHPWLVRQEDLNFTLPGDYLRKVDAASMAVPVETRAPFLDRRLLLATDELGEKLVLGGRKRFLRDIARRYLPKGIVDRPKQGFAIPVGEWFRTDFGGMRQLLYDHLEDPEPFPGLAGGGIELNMEFVRQMLREHDAAGEKSLNPWHGRDHSQRLYMLLVLSIWAKWLESAREKLQTVPSC